MVHSAVIGLMLITAAASAQPTEPPVLSGPVVSAEREQRPTLVQWGYDGRLVMLDASVEQAAIDLLDLDPESREKVDSILAERMAIFDEAVIESLDLVVRFDAARGAKNIRAMGETIGALMGRLSPLVRRGPAVRELAAVLPHQHAEHFRALVTEYQKAIVTDGKRLAEREYRRFKPIESALQARGEALGQEIDRSIKRSAAMGDAGFEILLQSLELEEEVESLIRIRTQEFVQAVGFNPSKEENDTFFSKLFLELDRPTRVKVMSGVLKFQRDGLTYGYGQKVMDSGEEPSTDD